jgi:hypothetical protein
MYFLHQFDMCTHFYLVPEDPLPTNGFFLIQDPCWQLVVSNFLCATSHTHTALSLRPTSVGGHTLRCLHVMTACFLKSLASRQAPPAPRAAAAALSAGAARHVPHLDPRCSRSCSCLNKCDAVDEIKSKLLLQHTV